MGPSKTQMQPLPSYLPLNSHAAVCGSIHMHGNLRGSMNAAVFHIITMVRLATLAALFATLLLVAHATAFRTTITTVDVDTDIENQQRRGERCREQIQRQQNLNHCQRYMMQQSESGSDEDGNQQQHLQQCCQQLRRMDEQCRCEGLRQVVRQQQGELQGEEMREMMECARDLPNQCRLSPQHCEIRSSWF
ncbi:2S seed storage albumin protein-like [Alnus glutinosa]|uniref:2S seed storage albumin protein-like n=1 Tax=Alnus glutinosa TaxID=3517 RepID=UPI002D7759E3|nr:2S seed storage albumin protein-like [Alnus glutinosa]